MFAFVACGLFSQDNLLVSTTHMATKGYNERFFFIKLPGRLLSRESVIPNNCCSERSLLPKSCVLLWPFYNVTRKLKWNIIPCAAGLKLLYCFQIISITWERQNVKEYPLFSFPLNIMFRRVLPTFKFLPERVRFWSNWRKRRVILQGSQLQNKNYKLLDSWGETMTAISEGVFSYYLYPSV